MSSRGEGHRNRIFHLVITCRKDFAMVRVGRNVMIEIILLVFNDKRENCLPSQGKEIFPANLINWYCVLKAVFPSCFSMVHDGQCQGHCN